MPVGNLNLKVDLLREGGNWKIGANPGPWNPWNSPPNGIPKERPRKIPRGPFQSQTLFEIKEFF